MDQLALRSSKSAKSNYANIDRSIGGSDGITIVPIVPLGIGHASPLTPLSPKDCWENSMRTFAVQILLFFQFVVKVRLASLY